MIIRLTRLEWWHSFRPPNEHRAAVAANLIRSVSEYRDDDRNGTEVVFIDGERWIVRETVDEVLNAMSWAGTESAKDTGGA